jgi:hypothetical protein
MQLVQILGLHPQEFQQWVSFLLQVVVPVVPAPGVAVVVPENWFFAAVTR